VSAGTDDDNHHLHIREFQVFDNMNTQLTLSIIDFDSQIDPWPVSNTIDGNLDTFSHSYFPEDISKDHFILYQVNGIEDYCDISNIDIYNRIDGDLHASHRIIGSYINVIQDEVTIGTFDITQDLPLYTFNINQLTTYTDDCLGTDAPTEEPADEPL